MKEALRRDVEQTKHDLGARGAADLNQDVGDTVRQGLGKDPIPPGDLPNEDWESSTRYGYGAGLSDAYRPHAAWGDEEREIAQGAGGYARPMPEAWMKRQAAAVAERVKLADIVITTALIPGRKAPVLVTEDMVKSMKPGSVIVDMAAEQGGNCPLSEPDRIVERHGVQIVGATNLPALVAADASSLYARNVLDFLKLVLPKEGGLKVDLEDDIVAACLMTQNGEVRRK